MDSYSETDKYFESIKYACKDCPQDDPEHGEDSRANLFIVDPGCKNIMVKLGPHWLAIDEDILNHENVDCDHENKDGQRVSAQPDKRTQDNINDFPIPGVFSS